MSILTIREKNPEQNKTQDRCLTRTEIWCSKGLERLHKSSYRIYVLPTVLSLCFKKSSTKYCYHKLKTGTGFKYNS